MIEKRRLFTSVSERNTIVTYSLWCVRDVHMILSSRLLALSWLLRKNIFSTPDRVAGCGNVGLVIVREEAKRFVYVRRLIDTDDHDAGLSSFSFYVHQKCNTSGLTAESSGLEIIFHSWGTKKTDYASLLMLTLMGLNPGKNITHDGILLLLFLWFVCV